jgi:hypothetical protein
MLKIFSAFLKDAATRFNRIARSLRGQIKPGDLHADAWMVAAEIAEKRGKEIDFSDPADQNLVLNRIYWNVKGQRDWRLGSAYSIDDAPEGRTPWADRLAAPMSTSPLEILVNREISAMIDAALEASYSQAKAYIVALANFKDDRQRFCAHLRIAHPALMKREHNARQIVKRQPSLFDGLETIDPAFEPHHGREIVSKEEVEIEAEQWELAF